MEQKIQKNEHLYIYDRLTKMNFLVPDQNPERKNRPAKWTDDSSMLFYVAVDDENVSRIIKYDLEKQESKQTIFLNAELCDISRDKSRILVNKRNLNYLPQFHILHLENDSIEKLNPKNINLLGGLFGQDHHYIYYLITDDLYLNNLYEKKSIRLVKNINGFGLSNDRKKIAYVDKNGIIYTMDWEGKNQRMIRALH